MKHIKTAAHRTKFEILAATRDCQAAMMTLRPGATSDDEPSNEHRHSEQWLFVIAGSGQAMIGRRKSALRRVALKERSLLIIEKGELHQIENTGARNLTTLNLYVPPAYDPSGKPK